jgi:hypothetical protein
VPGDVVIRASAVIDEQRKNLPVNRIHTQDLCRYYVQTGIDNV